jgi:hypothetical protein
MVKGTRLESKSPHLQTRPLRKGWIFFWVTTVVPLVHGSIVYGPTPSYMVPPSPPHIPPYIGVFWRSVQGGQCRERNFFGKKVEKSETTPICEKKIFGKFCGIFTIYFKI